MSGYAIWGHDTGGYQDTNFSVSPPNLFMRWTQFGCFSPIMQMHRQVATEMQYPWRYGQQALDNYRFYARLHTQLFPYIYTYAKRASIDGLPIIRPLVLMAQDDPNTFGLRHVYHFGNETPCRADRAAERRHAASLSPERRLVRLLDQYARHPAGRRSPGRITIRPTFRCSSAKAASYRCCLTGRHAVRRRLRQQRRRSGRSLADCTF